MLNEKMDKKLGSVDAAETDAADEGESMDVASAAKDSAIADLFAAFETKDKGAASRALTAFVSACEPDDYGTE